MADESSGKRGAAGETNDADEADDACNEAETETEDEIVALGRELTRASSRCANADSRESRSIPPRRPCS